jgi:hypothetical protein
MVVLEAWGNHPCSIPLLDHTMAQAVSRRTFTAEALVHARVSPCGICGVKNGTGTDFPPSSLVFPCQYHSTVVLHTHIAWGWRIGSLVAAVQRHSLTPSTWKMPLLWDAVCGNCHPFPYPKKCRVTCSRRSLAGLLEETNCGMQPGWQLARSHLRVAKTSPISSSMSVCSHGHLNILNPIGKFYYSLLDTFQFRLKRNNNNERSLWRYKCVFAREIDGGESPASRSTTCGNTLDVILQRNWRQPAELLTSDVTSVFGKWQV